MFYVQYYLFISLQTTAHSLGKLVKGEQSATKSGVDGLCIASHTSVNYISKENPGIFLHTVNRVLYVTTTPVIPNEENYSYFFKRQSQEVGILGFFIDKT